MYAINKLLIMHKDKTASLGGYFSMLHVPCVQTRS